MTDGVKRRLRIVALLLVGVVGLGAYAFMAGSRPNAANEEIGRPAPDFTLEQIDGEVFRLSDHRGKVVVLNFWATWCPPCREEIPDFVALQGEMESDVLFAGVSMDKGEPDSVRAFARDFGINYPIVIDDGTVLQKYGRLPGLPTTFLIGRTGTIQAVATGMLTRDNLRPVLETLVSGKELRDLEPPLFKLGHQP